MATLVRVLGVPGDHEKDGEGPREVLLDVTELYNNPVRTGIQRVVRAILRGWQSHQRLIPCRFDAKRGALIALSGSIVKILSDQAPYNRMLPAQLRQCMIVVEQSVPRPDALDWTGRRILIPEIFFDQRRAAFYLDILADRPDTLYVLFYDFLAWLRPELFANSTMEPTMWYWRLATQVRNGAAISPETARCWNNTVRLDPQGRVTVLPLGCDGLDTPPQKFNPDRQVVLAIGSVDERKNQRNLLDAYLLHLQRGGRLALIIAGRVFDKTTPTAQLLREMAAAGMVTHLDGLEDAALNDMMTAARCTIYLSEAEGFGLPPVEGLWAGVPAIVSPHLPSVEGIEAGVMRVQPTDALSIANALDRIADNAFASGLWSEASREGLSSWSDFMVALARWVLANEDEHEHHSVA